MALPDMTFCNALRTRLLQACCFFRRRTVTVLSLTARCRRQKCLFRRHEQMPLLTENAVPDETRLCVRVGSSSFQARRNTTCRKKKPQLPASFRQVVFLYFLAIPSKKSYYGQADTVDFLINADSVDIRHAADMFNVLRDLR